MGVLRTILIIALVYYGIKVLARIFSPFLMKFAAKKAEQHFNGQFKQYQKQQEPKAKKEGEVTIEKIPNAKVSNTDLGDYVDFEEVE